MDLNASQPRPEGVISPPTHAPTSSGPAEVSAATPNPQTSADHAPVHRQQVSAAPAAPSSAPNPQPCRPLPATQDRPNTSAGQVISLATALLGLSAAPGYYTPQDEIPGPWVDLFLEKHADGEVFSKLCGVSLTTLIWCLQHAPSVHLRFYPPSFKDPVAWLARLPSTRAGLAARGELPTLLTVMIQNSNESECALAALPSFLRGVGQGIRSLHFTSSSHSLERGSAFLRCVSLAVPNLTSLTLYARGCALPQPQYLPHLTQLMVSQAQASACASIAPYLRQLTSLSLFTAQHLQEEADLVDAVFTTHTTTLTSLTTDLPFSDDLLGLLLSYTPALTKLTVGPVTFEDEEWAGAHWSVTELCIAVRPSHGQIPAVEAWQVPVLPTVAGGVTELHVAELDIYVDQEGMDDELFDCLDKWRFESGCIRVIAEEDMEATDQPIALIATLIQLRDMQAPTSQIQFRDWHWTPAMARSVAAAEPSLAHLQLGVHVDTLTDELLGVVLLMGPHMRRLSVGQLDLHSNQHADKTWPWSEVYITQCDIASLVRLPNPGGSETQRAVHCNVLDIHGASLAEVGMQRLLPWLNHVLWKRLSHTKALEVCLHPSSDASEVSDQLAALRAVRVASQYDFDHRVVVSKWVMTHEVMQPLAGLPAWNAELVFRECEWPLDPSEYRDLASHVPVAYHTWKLGYTEACSQRLESIISGVKERRGRESKVRTLVMLVQSREAYQAVAEKGLDDALVYVCSDFDD